MSESTARRLTESIGLAYEAVQRTEVERIERDWPAVPEGPDQRVLSGAGAFVPVLHGEWAEVKTLVVAEVGHPTVGDGTTVVPTHSHSSFSRLAEAEVFQRLTLGELYRRRLETAGHLAAVSDGAEWIQGFIDFHCPNATRIRDFPHAAQRICQIGEAVLGTDHAGLPAWQTRQLHSLNHHGPEGVLDNLRTVAAEQLSEPLIAENLASLEKRQAQMQYPTFQAQGWPIGSGMVESANKVVVEARLKGAGMHWSRLSVNPLLALRNAVCNDRWAEAWHQACDAYPAGGAVSAAARDQKRCGSGAATCDRGACRSGADDGTGRAGDATEAAGRPSLAAEEPRDTSRYRPGTRPSKTLTDTRAA